ncbi:DUF3168 domain-containing protein [Peteryoungia desertarenae]|uniref:DUF3168 domain-containing protein n=1 Tax=Peteryoungia desertarenae TaxID=1813451 RepID=A0ABX6QNQ7_9HYPH|nr:DUF3168 domain-containing protein [Peteryoungia desertarenae]QLF69870.1 DUF3168 domain-containing protein [Peteryoungia desertarenae]
MGAKVNDLLVALQSAVSSDPVLTGFLGSDGLTDRRHRATRLPRLSLGSVESRDYSTASEASLECFLTLEIWSETGRREAELLADRLRALALGLGENIGETRLANMLHRRTASRRDMRTGLFVAEVTVRAVLE